MPLTNDFKQNQVFDLAGVRQNALNAPTGAKGRPPGMIGPPIQEPPPIQSGPPGGSPGPEPVFPPIPTGTAAPNSVPFNPNEWLVQGEWTWVPSMGRWLPTRQARGIPGFPGAVTTNTGRPPGMIGPPVRIPPPIQSGPPGGTPGPITGPPKPVTISPPGGSPGPQPASQPAAFTDIPPMPNSAPFNPNGVLIQGFWTWMPADRFPGMGWIPTSRAKLLLGQNDPFPGGGGGLPPNAVDLAGPPPKPWSPWGGGSGPYVPPPTPAPTDGAANALQFLPNAQPGGGILALLRSLGVF